MIRQCIPADREKAAAFLKTTPSGEGFNFDGVELQLCLIAQEAETTLGVALCRRIPGTQSRELTVIVAADQPTLVQTLVDKALVKVHAHGVHKCKVVIPGADIQPLWEQTRWQGNVPSAA